MVERISKEKDNRPLVKNIADEELPEFIGKHLFERRPYYLQAKHILDCNNLDAETVVGRIKELL